MKHPLYAWLLLTCTGSVLAAEVNVGVSVSEPGFYGRIDIGSLPAPKPVNPEPVVIVSSPSVASPPPLYLRVPPAQQKNWKKYCKRYKACDHPVLFVNDDWYNGVYVPSKGKRPDKHENRGKGHGRGHD